MTPEQREEYRKLYHRFKVVMTLALVCWIGALTMSLLMLVRISSK